MGSNQEEISTIKVGDKVKFNQIGVDYLRPHRIREDLSSNIQGKIESFFLVVDQILYV